MNSAPITSAAATSVSAIRLENIDVTTLDPLKIGKIRNAQASATTLLYMRSEHCPELEDKYLLNQHQVCCTPCELDAPLFHVSAEHKGERDYMEDRHRVIHKYGALRGYFAVFDGHSGWRASAHCAKHLHTILEARLENNAFINLGQGCQELFQEFDADLLNRERALGWNDGSTAVVVLINDDSVVCANVGDSRAVMSRGGKALDLSIDHKPSRPSEYDRILANGGTVKRLTGSETCFGCFQMPIEMGPERIYPGGIAVSRAMGDLVLKDPTRFVVPNSKILIAVPEIIEYKLSPDDQFILIASDGLWDAMDSQEAVDMVLDLILHGNDSDFAHPQAVANSVVDYARQWGTGDNITLVIVFFKPAMEDLCATEMSRLRKEYSKSKKEEAATLEATLESRQAKLALEQELIDALGTDTPSPITVPPRPPSKYETDSDV